MEEFRKMIDIETEKACGQNKGISNVPLRIRFYSRRVLDLLLVCLSNACGFTCAAAAAAAEGAVIFGHG